MSLPVYPSGVGNEFEEITLEQVMNLFKEEHILKNKEVLKKDLNNKIWYIISETEGSPLYQRIRERLYRSYQVQTRTTLQFSENKYKNIRLEPVYSLALVPNKYTQIVKMQESEYPIGEEGFTLSVGFIKGVGSLWNWGKTKKDIDIVIEQYSDTDLYKASEKIITSILDTINLGERVSYHYAQDSLGPYSDYANLYDLVLIPYKESITTEHSKFKLFPSSPMEFEKPLAGRYKNKAYNFVDLLKIIEQEGYSLEEGWLTGIKRDGMTSRVDWDGDKVEIHSEGWKNITPNLPTIVEEFKKRSDSGSAIGEIELYINGVHENRADASAAAVHPNNPNEPNLRITLYDLFYINGKDISSEPYFERRNQLTKFKASKHVFISNPEYKVSNAKDLEKAITRCMEPSWSEGAVLKHSKKPYAFKVHPKDPGMIKIKKTFIITGRVIGKEPVAGSKDTFVYDIAIDGSKIEK